MNRHKDNDGGIRLGGSRVRTWSRLRRTEQRDDYKNEGILGKRYESISLVKVY